MAMTSDPLPDRPQWDHERDEPFIPLPGHPDLRLTPWSQQDGPAAVATWNDPLVGKYASRRPFPYRESDMGYIWNVVKPQCDKSLDLLRPILSHGLTLPPPPDDTLFPCQVVRHYPSGRFIGDCVLFDDAGARSSTGAQSPAWTVAYTLAPEYRGQGVVKAALAAMMSAWVGWVGIEKVLGTAERANPASLAIMRANGFQVVEELSRQWPPDKGGGERVIVNLVWSSSV